MKSLILKVAGAVQTLELAEAVGRKVYERLPATARRRIEKKAGELVDVAADKALEVAAKQMPSLAGKFVKAKGKTPQAPAVDPAVAAIAEQMQRLNEQLAALSQQQGGTKPAAKKTAAKRAPRKSA